MRVTFAGVEVEGIESVESSTLRVPHWVELSEKTKRYRYMSNVPSQRVECPYCRGHNVVNLDDLLRSPRSDFFRCCVCLSWWMVPKGTDEPVTRIVLRNHSSSVN